METIGDILRRPEFEGVTRRQVDHTIRELGIVASQRVGIIRLFSPADVRRIRRRLDALKLDGRSGRRRR